MKITNREITKAEHQMMLDDFRKIEIAHGVPRVRPSGFNNLRFS